MPIYLLIGKKNVLERICGAYETHILCQTHPFSQSCDVNETHILCLTPPSRNRIIFMKHKLFVWNNLSAIRMVFMKHTVCAWHTLSAIVWCPWTKCVGLTHPFRKSRGFRVKDFVALLLTFSLIIECEQKATKWRHVLTLKLSYLHFSQQWMLILWCEAVYCDT